MERIEVKNYEFLKALARKFKEDNSSVLVPIKSNSGIKNLYGIIIELNDLGLILSNENRTSFVQYDLILSITKINRKIQVEKEIIEPPVDHWIGDEK